MKLTMVLLLFPFSVFANDTAWETDSRNKFISKRMFSGKEIYIDRAPHMALVFADKSYSDLPFCSAAIITTRHLISTAYFFKMHEHKDFKVVTGHTYAYQIDQKEYHAVKKIYIHEKFDPTEVYYDIALIELKGLLQLTFTVKLIKLATLDSVKKIQIPATMKVTGYGKQSNEKIGRLVEKQVEISDPYFVHNFTDRLVVFEKNSLNICYGDSGNPGVIDGNLTALTIYQSSYCGDFPAFFTGIPYYYEWIKFYVGAERLEKYPDLK